MSRSKRKKPIFAYTTSTSEKQDKRIWNKRFRRVSKLLIQNDKDLPLKLAAVANVWDGSKDGKHYWNEYSAKHLRK